MTMLLNVQVIAVSMQCRKVCRKQPTLFTTRMIDCKTLAFISNKTTFSTYYQDLKKDLKFNSLFLTPEFISNISNIIS